MMVVNVMVVVMIMMGVMLVVMMIVMMMVMMMVTMIVRMERFFCLKWFCPPTYLFAPLVLFLQIYL